MKRQGCLTFTCKYVHGVEPNPEVSLDHTEAHLVILPVAVEWHVAIPAPHDDSGTAGGMGRVVTEHLASNTK